MAAMTFLQWHLLSLKMAGTGYDASSSSTINQLVCGLMENPHFLDVLERSSRRINSPQMTSQPAASCSTSSSRPFQTPVEEFRSLFRTGTASSTSIPRFRRFHQQPRGRPYVASRIGRCTGSHSHRATSTSTAASPGAGSKVQQTSFCREVVLLNDPQDVSVVRGARKANLHRSGNVLSAFMFNKSWTALEVCENLERAFPKLNNVEEKPK